ncbi:MAG: corrinoid protein [Anaerolineales bacterium]|jgi:corrinoid protein of di/trimethylamine methyltransferase
MPQDILNQLTQSLIDGQPDMTLELTQGAIQAGIEPMAIIDDGLVPGMDVVGQKFADGEFFLPHLVIAGSAMQKAMALLQPELEKRQQSVTRYGKVVIGTVKGDIHEIGKMLVAILLSVSGFEVHDLGVDVATEDFVSKVKETGATMVGLSALLTTTMTFQREVIEALAEADLRGQVKVMVGGAPVSQAWADSIGADGYAEDAKAAVALAKHLAEEASS